MQSFSTIAQANNGKGAKLGTNETDIIQINN